MRIIDKYTKSELEEIISKCDSWRGVCRELGYKSHSGNIIAGIKKVFEEKGISTEHFTSSHAPLTGCRKDDVLVKNTTAADNTVRAHYLKGNYSEYKCAICGLPPIWQGRPLVLTLDHISGDHFDSRPENLRWVCPNCDRQLPTFGGKNHKK